MPQELSNEFAPGRISSLSTEQTHQKCLDALMCILQGVWWNPYIEVFRIDAVVGGR
jgi:hypothetical protein